MRVILASSSVQRQDIFKMIGLKYEIVTSNACEKSDKEKPDEYAEDISRKKAVSVRGKITGDAVIIAADTIVYFNGKIYGKPANKEAAAKDLRELSGNESFAYTGVTILDTYKGKTLTFSSKTGVYLKKISEEEIKWYVDNEKKVLNACGYAAMGKAALFVDKIDGDYNAMLGISPALVFEKLKELGYGIGDLDFV